MSHQAKQRIYEQFARVGKALASPQRLELLDLLGQGERSVDALATACELSVANASQHLQVLAAARLVETRRDGQRILYRIADPSVEAACQALRHTAEQRLADLDAVARAYLTGRDELEPIERGELLRRMKAGTVTLLDVRPAEEFRAAHLPGAISVPVDDVERWAERAPRKRPIVAYCRGPYCVYALRAVAALRERGLTALRLEDGVAEWRVAGLPLEAAAVIFRPFYRYETGCAAYLFGCGSLGKCCVVDPQQADVDAYEAFAAAKGMRITHVFDTHLHADHRSGARTLAARTGAAYLLHRAAEVAFPFTPLDDGQVIELGNSQVRVLHTPGHTPESVCLVVTDLRRGPEPWFVCTGDTLFVGAVGRPDLPGHERENAAELHRSVHEKLLTLPDEVEVYPAHFGGSSCGAGLSGKPASTIGFERRWNPLLAAGRAAFVEELCAAVPAKPADMAAILDGNRGLTG